jgi:glycosyltransferase involved in cell wall biosynthesis
MKGRTVVAKMLTQLKDAYGLVYHSTQLMSKSPTKSNPSPGAADATEALRILVLAGSFHPIVGGGERHAHLLCRAWSRQGHQVTVVTRRTTAQLPQHETQDGMTIFRIAPSGFPRLGKYLMIVPAIHRLWRLREDYDLIYVCGLRVLGLAGVIAQQLTGKPCVLRAEARGEWSGAFIWKSPEGHVSPIKRTLFQPLIQLRNLCLRSARRFLAISTPIRQEFQAGGIPEEQLALIPNGFDPDEFYPPTPAQRQALRETFGFQHNRIFMYSGKLNRGKGLELLLRVWARYSAAYPNDRLLLVGSGKGQSLSCEAQLRSFVDEHRLNHSVTFTGYTDRVADYLRAADCFLFPSESEAQGLAPLEAMACGLPVIASRIPGIMDMIQDGENGTLIEVHDETAWLTAMQAFATQPDQFAQHRHRAQELARHRYTIDAVAQAHNRQLQQLLVKT